MIRTKRPFGIRQSVICAVLFITLSLSACTSATPPPTAIPPTAMPQPTPTWNPTPFQTFSGHTDAVSSVAISPDSKYVITGSGDGTVRLWDAATGKEIRQLKIDAPVNSLAFSPDGKFVGIASRGERTA